MLMLMTASRIMRLLKSLLPVPSVDFLFLGDTMVLLLSDVIGLYLTVDWLPLLRRCRVFLLSCWGRLLVLLVLVCFLALVVPCGLLFGSSVLGVGRETGVLSCVSRSWFLVISAGIPS